MLIVTEAVVADAPEKDDKKQTPGMHGHSEEY
jgi:hypothetical protein